MQTLDTPVVFIIFNRPDLTKQVFEVIEKAQPAKLYIVADGPRLNNERDAKLCKETKAIVENISWRCEVKRNYSETNLGCGKRITTGLDWVFNQCDKAIILEDDCLPTEDFFAYCEELLSRYESNNYIFSISGFSAPAQSTKELPESYYFSKFFNMWGWATWKRAWQNNDFIMEKWPEIKKTSILENSITDTTIARQMERDFDNVYANNGKKGIVDTWDFQFALTHFIHNAYAIKPTSNLVTNIGVGNKDATHTKLNHKLGKVEIETLNFPLIHPASIEWNQKEDLEVFKAYYKKSELLFKIKRVLKKIYHSFFPRT